MDSRYESWVERQIREAQERGEFDNLPGAGKPLEFLEKPQEEDWWIKRLIEREQLDMTAALPPQLALRKEAQALPEMILQERSEQTVRDLVEDFNARVRECWRRPMDGPVVAVRTVDVDEMVATWRAHRSRPPTAAKTEPTQEAPGRGTRARPSGALAKLTRLSPFSGWPRQRP